MGKSENQTEVNGLLKQLGKILDLPLELDANNRCLILLDEKIVLNLELDEERHELIVYAYISVVPFAAKELVLGILLEANFFWRISNGSTFALDKQTQTLVLQRKFELPLREVENFEDDIAVFVDVAEAWMKRIDDICSEAELLLEEDSKTKTEEKEYGSWKY